MPLTDEQRDSIAERVAAFRERQQAAAPKWTEPKRQRRRTPQSSGRPCTAETRKRIAASNFDRHWRGVDLDSLPLLTRARVTRGLSASSAAYEAGVSVTAFKRAEKGDNITTETRRRIIATFGPEAFDDA